MPANKQDAAIQAAGELAQLMINMRNIREQARGFSDKYNSMQYSDLWAAMATSAPNADGSMGDPDPTPVPSHPISVGGINRSHDELVAAVVVLQDFIGFCTSVDLPAGQRSQNIDDLVS